MNDDNSTLPGSRADLEKAIGKILHRHCNFGWANYYIPSEKFPALVKELIDQFGPGASVSHDELVNFFLSAQRAESIQDRVAKLEAEYSVHRRG